ncbi:MAG: arginine--tRNA ligase [Erysipelotrichaceae bacterium]|nr:arginine--tRNA ligase [Erysipelotrichaceae bacterium]
MNKIEEKLIGLLKKACKEAFDLDVDDSLLMIEIPRDNSNGDYSTNIAMRLAKVLKQRPSEIAGKLKEYLKSDDILKTEVAGPGFINFWMRKDAIADVINVILDKKENYGKSEEKKDEKILLEYVSANPTGILHLGHARGAAWGDSVARLLRFAGYEALREYYINDAGNQMNMLALSVEARYREAFGKDFELPEDGYHGQDVKNIALKIKERDGDRWLNTDRETALAFFKEEGYRLEMERIRTDLEYYRCEFDSWISEQKLVDEDRVTKAIRKMVDMGLTYEKDGALWFRSTVYGDDKDRVLRKQNGFYTYLAPDIANHLYKLERGYTKLVNLWGADHHGYIPRMKAALEAMGYPKDCMEVDIIQMVRLVENGEEVKMSKRTGNAVTIRELCDDIGVDAARYFFLAKALDTQFDFDLGLARSQSNDNPVYYVQYAYARICSVLRQAPEHQRQSSYSLLVSEKETDLLKHLNEFPATIEDAAATRSPNKLCNYIQKLAQYFHSFYSSCKVIDDNRELMNERLCLLEAVKITLGNALDLLGINAPEKM